MTSFESLVPFSGAEDGLLRVLSENSSQSEVISGDSSDGSATPTYVNSGFPHILFACLYRSSISCLVLCKYYSGFASNTIPSLDIRHKDEWYLKLEQLVFLYDFMLSLSRGFHFVRNIKHVLLVMLRRKIGADGVGGWSENDDKSELEADLSRFKAEMSGRISVGNHAYRAS